MTNIWPGFVATQNRSRLDLERMQQLQRRLRRELKSERQRRVMYIVVALIGGAIVGSSFSKAHSQRQYGKPSLAKVRAGDSLWGIARHYPKAGVATAQRVVDIQRANPKTSYVLIPGDTLVIPFD